MFVWQQLQLLKFGLKGLFFSLMVKYVDAQDSPFT